MEAVTFSDPLGDCGASLSGTVIEAVGETFVGRGGGEVVLECGGEELRWGEGGAGVTWC
jgi:hypothetical protein